MHFDSSNRRDLSREHDLSSHGADRLI